MFLLIDTTEDKSQVALLEVNQVLRHRIFLANFKHSEKLLLEICKILKNGKDKLSSLKAIIVITGPGGFTGSRVGVATANALAYSLGIFVVGINKNEIFGRNIEKKDIFSRRSVLKISLIANERIRNGKFVKFTLPFYRDPPHITKPKPII